MKRKPWTIILLSALHILAPFGNIVLNSFRSGRSFSQTWAYWLNVIPGPLFLTYVLLPPLAGVFIFICKRWSYWCYVACLGLIFLGNLYGFWTSVNWLNFLTLFLVLVVDVLVVAYFVVPSVRKVYFDPRMRWWETAPRYLFDTEGTVNRAIGTIKNISAGGLLVETLTSFSEGQSVEIQWRYEGVPYLVPGNVVYRKPQGAGFGYGIRFTHTPETEKAVENLVRQLHKHGKLIRDRLPGPEDSFGVWLKKLVVSREGLFPRA